MAPLLHRYNAVVGKGDSKARPSAGLHHVLGEKLHPQGARDFPPVPLDDDASLDPADFPKGSLGCISAARQKRENQREQQHDPYSCGLHGPLLWASKKAVLPQARTRARALKIPEWISYHADTAISCGQGHSHPARRFTFRTPR